MKRNSTRLARAAPGFFVLCALGWTAASPLRAAPEPLRLSVSGQTHNWSLQERVGTAYRTLMREASVRAMLTDGSQAAWTRASLAPDGHSMTYESADLTLKIIVQWLDPQRLPATVTLLPIVWPKRDGVQLAELRLMHQARLPTVPADAVALEHGYGSDSDSAMRLVREDAPLVSWWLTALHSRSQSMVAGYLSSVVGENAFVVSRGAEGLAISDRSDLRRLTVPRVADGTPLDALYLSWGASPTRMLAEYAAGARAFTNVVDPAPAFLPQPTPEGWAASDSLAGGLTEESVLTNAAALRRIAGPRNGLLVRIGDGFEAHAGDWEPGPGFPRGHRWLTETLGARGFQAGLRIAPFAISVNSRVFKEHPEWLLLDGEGRPVVVEDGDSGGLYVLDPSVQPARAWLRDLLQTITRQWGYRHILLDDLSLATLGRGVMRGNMTPVEAYRAALRAMRLGAGKETYLLAGGAPMGPTLGLVNGARVASVPALDRPPVDGVARGAALRQWMHNVWWQNDPGPLNLGGAIPDDAARAWTSLVALSGGLAILGGDLAGSGPAAVPEERFAMARMALPVLANGAAPPFNSSAMKAARATGARLADMWTSGDHVPGPPSVWWLPSDASPVRITEVAVFNWTDKEQRRVVTPAAFGVTPEGRRAHVWDVWERRYLGAPTGALTLDAPPRGVRLLCLTPDVGYPQVLGTDAHVVSARPRLLGASYDAKYRALKGRANVTLHAPFHLALTVPKGLALFRLDAPGAVVERLPSEDGSALFRITPERAEIAWTARYARG